MHSLIWSKRNTAVVHHPSQQRGTRDRFQQRGRYVVMDQPISEDHHTPPVETARSTLAALRVQSHSGLCSPGATLHIAPASVPAFSSFDLLHSRWFDPLITITVVASAFLSL